MRLSKIYSNKTDFFQDIEFNRGLNIIIGEIRLPENKKKDTHNLGKSILASLIDFCLLKGYSKDFFLFKHFNLFKDFIFFLEVEVKNDKFLTIKRKVDGHSKISFLEHSKNNLNLKDLPDEDWTHLDIPFEKATQFLDGFLNLSIISPWDYRKPISYCLRTQDDYNDVYQLKKFVKHIDWKPYIAKLLGLNHELVKKQYILKDEYDKAKVEKEKLKNKLGSFSDSIDKLEGLILIKEEEAGNIKAQLEYFNFEIEDADVNKHLVEELDNEIAVLNKSRYYLSSSLEKLKTSLEKHNVIFNLEEAEQILQEAGILFSGQIKKSYDELIEFNKEITEERKKYLQEEFNDIQNELINIDKELKILNKKRSEAMYFLKDAKILDKYKSLSSNLVTIEAEIITLKNRGEELVAYNQAIESFEHYKSELEKNKSSILESIKTTRSKDSTYSKIKLNFNHIVKSMLDKDALISVEQNGEGNLEFKADILNSKGLETSESDGKTYKKLLCMAFDIAINQVYLNEHYTHFIYHDGFLEKLDNRKKDQFIEIIRDLSSNGLQYIGTLIDSEIPATNENFFKDKEIILKLHDDGIDGKLFKMENW